VGFERELGVPTSDLEKALELMLTLPQKSADEKFLNSIEGYKGSVKNLGRLIAHVSLIERFPQIMGLLALKTEGEIFLIGLV